MNLERKISKYSPADTFFFNRLSEIIIFRECAPGCAKIQVLFCPFLAYCIANAILAIELNRPEFRGNLIPSMSLIQLECPVCSALKDHGCLKRLIPFKIGFEHDNFIDLINLRRQCDIGITLIMTESHRLIGMVQ